MREGLIYIYKDKKVSKIFFVKKGVCEITQEKCVQYGDTSEFIQNTVRNNPGKDWLFALCLDPRTGGRGYILPVYNATEENPSGKTPYEMQKIILDFEYVMTQSVIPEVLGIPSNMIPPKTARYKSW